uniref:Apoptosis inducing factor mitochondria associated 4 n=1 Tax=Sphaeramia orbicularis TaxID=375764 RepID=A0A672ZB79_9TELE
MMISVLICLTVMNQSHEEGGGGKEEEMITALVCPEEDLKDGEMKVVTVGDQKVLLVRTHGQFSALGSQCSHYNAPLVKGVLIGDRVRCPFHGACFNVRTGDIEEFPGLDSLPCYKVKVEDGQVYVSIDKKVSQSMVNRKNSKSCVPSLRVTVHFVISGPAALLCAETLRQNCYQGRIIMVTKDTLPPIDKPKLSKVRTQAHSYNYPFAYRARSLSCPGWDLEGVKMLQCYEDARDIDSSSLGQRTVVIGASFIGMEVASYLSDKAANVAVVGTSRYPYERSFGSEIGKMCMQMLEERNVKLYMSDGVSEIRGQNGKVKEVVLKSGTVLEADVVITGIGVIPNSDFLSGSGIEVDSHKAVIVDKFMRANVPDVFSAGDVTAFPLTMRGDQRVSIAHWQMSHAQGRVAALNMLKKPTKLESVPFFWTVLLGKSIRYTGYGEGYTEIIFKGKVAEQKFLAFYIKDEVVVAAASLMFDPAVARLAELMAKVSPYIYTN